MRPTVYIETTVPSYYWDERPELIQRISRTREWWDKERDDYDCFISPLVLDELMAGTYPRKANCLELVRGISQLEITRDVTELADLYRSQKVMPLRPEADAIHVALATFYRIEFLLTWNCVHLANVNKQRHLETINKRLNYATPLLVTPDLLQPWERES